MLDYSKHLLEISSTRKIAETFEYRVLDTRMWNHYLTPLRCYELLLVVSLKNQRKFVNLPIYTSCTRKRGFNVH
jgi:hypothetical protein